MKLQLKRNVIKTLKLVLENERMLLLRAVRFV